MTIKIDNLVKKYGKKIAINNISIDIKDGEAIAFLGANGSGKTTLIEIIAGVLNETSGSVVIDGIDAKNYDEIGIQFQEGNWPKGTTPKSVIKFYKGNSFFKSDQVDLLDIFEVEPILNTDLNQLSGGQKQRFNALLSIINNPKIIILDELITGLDLKMQIRLVDYFKAYKKKNKCTLIVISHMPEEIEMLCDRIVLLENGSIFLDKPLKKLLKEHGSLREMMTKYFGGELNVEN
ncbi:ABC transporter ATP-binding protein [[Acholeplasma] multilocale]|uniref:ABC transporter ATP-binding protein n=1 Tax=[Acholeplasma] multilocale TaxID=264638 RepID=UPI00054DCCA1|nr:ABC transporter ATP-binding protein [[Acholeplasma] multilocale]